MRGREKNYKKIIARHNPAVLLVDGHSQIAYIGSKQTGHFNILLQLEKCYITLPQKAAFRNIDSPNADSVLPYHRLSLKSGERSGSACEWSQSCTLAHPHKKVLREEILFLWSSLLKFQTEGYTASNVKEFDTAHSLQTGVTTLCSVHTDQHRHIQNLLPHYLLEIYQVARAAHCTENSSLPLHTLLLGTWSLIVRYSNRGATVYYWDTCHKSTTFLNPREASLLCWFSLLHAMPRDDNLPLGLPVFRLYMNVDLINF